MKDNDSITNEEDAALWQRFERYVKNACNVTETGEQSKGSLLQTKSTLTKAYFKDGLAGLRVELDQLLYAFDLDARYSEPNLEQQRKIADLRYPAEWYAQARATQRTIHLHVGPTNSGKTYHALKRLETCKSGFYAGPLRLLAQEVYHRFKTSGIPCNLVTGDEVRISEGEKAVIVSNTVEMANLGQNYDVGVIDEIQMIADPRRGWAWTRAVLGCQAKELHLCGELRVVPLIRELAALTGDKLEIHRYERLNPLRAMKHSLKGDLSKLEKGDCIVSFSRVGIHALKAEIERKTGRRAAIIYGGLPAEIRTQQASLFNDPDNDYDFLVASDAIGMGLNLSCKRIIFETVVKNLRTGLQRLTVSEVKQIGGRAGRYRSAAQHGEDHQQDTENVGYVTSLEEVDLPYIQEALNTEAPPINAAGIAPPDPVYERFAAYFPGNTSLAYMVNRLTEIARINPLFFICDPTPCLENAEVIDAVPGLNLTDQLTLMAAPIGAREEIGRRVAMAFARCVLENKNGRLLDIEEINLEVLAEPVSGNKEYMHQLEALHRAVILYSWLSYRFGGIFTDRTLSVHVKELVEERLVRALTEFSANKKLRKNASLLRQIAMEKQQRVQREFASANGGAEIDLSESGESYGPSAFNVSDNENATETDILAEKQGSEVESALSSATRGSEDMAETDILADENQHEEESTLSNVLHSSENAARIGIAANEHGDEQKLELETSDNTRTGEDSMPESKEPAEHDPAHSALEEPSESNDATTDIKNLKESADHDPAGGVSEEQPQSENAAPEFGESADHDSTSGVPEEQPRSQDATPGSEESARHGLVVHNAVDGESELKDAMPESKEPAESDSAARNNEEEPAQKTSNH
ncbi:ATP-dependent RNA helicase SUV3 [Aspergillus mulundensis]|uniref:RNA helicase n=1 Tax=Aspergillus mulundensis TaxID=1810919 RepID=A0A3D8REL3_9EURO|nr:hypothetical protein DSM5745_07675 [Aspergillus mulundensis]RDW72503.1 hypothetical protein DSM5745_07675 [Aspergillus mulundensis]